MSKEEYYILKCPVCDENITKVMEFPDNEIICPSCKRVLSLYTVFGYNMWLSENGKSEKVNKKPIKDVIAREELNEDYAEYENDDEEEDDEHYIENEELIKKHPRVIHEMLSFNADLCLIQHNYLTRLGFTREEAVEIVKKLIEQGFIL